MPADTQPAFRDALYKLAQVGERVGVQLVRVVARESGNRYTARPVEFAADGATQFAEEATLTITNLAEPADVDGMLPAGAEVVAVDVEGRWVALLRPPAGTRFPAKVISADGDATYTVREQSIAADGSFADATGFVDVSARNLAELDLGPGAAVDVGTIVVAFSHYDTGDPPTLRYFFDHPPYAKYLD